MSCTVKVRTTCNQNHLIDTRCLRRNDTCSILKCIVKYHEVSVKIPGQKNRRELLDAIRRDQAAAPRRSRQEETRTTVHDINRYHNIIRHDTIHVLRGGLRHFAAARCHDSIVLVRCAFRERP